MAVPLLTQEARQVIHLLGVVPLPLPQGEGTFEVALPALSAPAAKVEVRAILPAGRPYELADVTRAGAVGPPPQAAARAADNAMARQVASSPGAALSVVNTSLFPCPPGFVQIFAAWSALSATPSALLLRAQAPRPERGDDPGAARSGRAAPSRRGALRGLAWRHRQLHGGPPARPRSREGGDGRGRRSAGRRLPPADGPSQVPAPGDRLSRAHLDAACGRGPPPGPRHSGDGRAGSLSRPLLLSGRGRPSAPRERLAPGGPGRPAAGVPRRPERPRPLGGMAAHRPADGSGHGRLAAAGDARPAVHGALPGDHDPADGGRHSAAPRPPDPASLGQPRRDARSRAAALRHPLVGQGGRPAGASAAAGKRHDLGPPWLRDGQGVGGRSDRRAGESDSPRPFRASPSACRDWPPRFRSIAGASSCRTATAIASAREISGRRFR